MAWLRRWWWRRHIDTTAEAKAHLARVEARDHEVAVLGEQLREVQRKNHFSPMVAAAITRSRGA